MSRASAILALALALATLTAPAAQAADLTVRVEAAEEHGALWVAAFADAASFDARAPAAAQAVGQDGQAIVVLDGLKAGIYAVAVFQDRDGDQTLDTGLFGRPTEPYGFSNDARGRAGPPPFSAAAIALPAEGGMITIRLDQP